MRFYLIFLAFVIGSCNESSQSDPAAKLNEMVRKDTPIALETPVVVPDTITRITARQEINTGSAYADSLVSYAETLLGTPYLYGSTDPANGFDCSGFITYVFNKFGIMVPRSSKDFENVGDPIMMFAAKRGDLILFTGTDSTDKTIGHMGIIASNNGGRIQFVHSSSGKANGVTVSPLNKYYMSRYVKIIRVFNQ